MSYKIKDLFNGQRLLGFDSPEVGIKDISTKDREYSVTCTSDRPDRFRDVVVQEGLQWNEWWPRNAIMPFAHNYSVLPVSKGVAKPWMEKKGKHTYTSIRAKMGSHPEALQVWGAIQEGLLNSASIGFLPLKQSNIERSEEEKKRKPFANPQKFEEAIILEVSLVPVPANPDASMALKQMVNAGHLPAYCLPPRDSRQHIDRVLASLQDNEFDAILADVDVGSVSDLEIKEIVKLTVRSIFTPEDSDDEDQDSDDDYDFRDDEPEADEEIDIDAIEEDDIDPGEVRELVKQALRASLGQLEDSALGKLED